MAVFFFIIKLRYTFYVLLLAFKEIIFASCIFEMAKLRVCSFFEVSAYIWYFITLASCMYYIQR